MTSDKMARKPGKKWKEIQQNAPRTVRRVEGNEDEERRRARAAKYGFVSKIMRRR